MYTVLVSSLRNECSPAGFTDRAGHLYLPLQALVAKTWRSENSIRFSSFCERTKGGCLHKLSSRARGWVHDILRSYLSSFALTRQRSGLLSEAE